VRKPPAPPRGELYLAERPSGSHVAPNDFQSISIHHPNWLSLNRTAMLYGKRWALPFGRKMCTTKLSRLSEKIEATPQESFRRNCRRRVRFLGQFFEKHRLKRQGGKKLMRLPLEIYREKTLAGSVAFRLCRCTNITVICSTIPQTRVG